MRTKQTKTKIVWTTTERKKVYQKVLEMYCNDTFQDHHGLTIETAQSEVLPENRRRGVDSIMLTMPEFKKKNILDEMYKDIEKKEKVSVKPKKKDRFAQIVDKPRFDLNGHKPKQEVITQSIFNTKAIEETVLKGITESIDKSIKCSVDQILSNLKVEDRVNALITKLETTDVKASMLIEHFQECLDNELLAFNQLLTEKLAQPEQQEEVPINSSEPAKPKRRIAILGTSGSQKQLILRKFKKSDLDITCYSKDQCQTRTVDIPPNFEKVFMYAAWVNHSTFAQVQHVYQSKDIIQINGGMWSIFNKISETMGVSISSV